MTNDVAYYEDIVLGQPLTYGSYAVTREEIVAFAGQYDPQAFHLDEEAGKASIFGGLAASGWHTCAMTMRMNVDHQTGKRATLGGAGIDRLRWSKPVFPGDTLSVRSTVLDKRRSRSRPEAGVLTQRQETLNQHGEVVMSYESTSLIGVRDPSAPIGEDGR